MRLDGDMKLDSAVTMAGDMKLDGAMRIEGPIQVQMSMQGPRVEYSGVYISEKLLDRVNTGKTTTDWLLAVFGEPTSRAALNDGSEIWKWAYVPLFEEKPMFAMLNTGGKDEPTVTQSTTFVQVRDGVVIETWRD